MNEVISWVVFAGAAGGTLLAAGETWQLVEHHDWPVWLLVVVMLTLATSRCWS